MPLKRKLVQFAFLCIDILNVPSAYFSHAQLSADTGTHVEVGITNSLCPLLWFFCMEPVMSDNHCIIFSSFSENSQISFCQSFSYMGLRWNPSSYFAALVPTKFSIFFQIPIFFISEWFTVFFAFWVPHLFLLHKLFFGFDPTFFFG